MHRWWDGFLTQYEAHGLYEFLTQYEAHGLYEFVTQYEAHGLYELPPAQMVLPSYKHHGGTMLVGAFLCALQRNRGSSSICACCIHKDNK
jgi:hypothetical protein